MCSNPCESEVTCFRPESNRGPYGLLNLLCAALSTTELWWRINHRKSFRTLLEGCTDCKVNTLRTQISPKMKKGVETKLQQTLGLVMRSALPEEIEKIFQHNLISDSTLTLTYIQGCLEDKMQEMGISAADAPPVGSLQSPFACGSKSQNWAILSLTTTTTGPHTHWWARSFVETYPDTRTWTTKMSRWDISTPAYAIPECWPAHCWRIGKPNLLWTTTTLVRPS